MALSLTTILLFLKRPHAFPFLLSLLLLLAWLSLRLQSSPNFYSSPSISSRPPSDTSADRAANLARYAVADLASDPRGWLLDPVAAARRAGIAGAQLCSSVHVGEIRPGGVRGNHRHHTCNESFIIWGARTKFRLENMQLENGYAEVIIAVDEIAVAASPTGTAHALINIDSSRTTFFLGCQDGSINYTSLTTDFRVWKDI